MSEQDLTQGLVVEDLRTRGRIEIRAFLPLSKRASSASHHAFERVHETPIPRQEGLRRSSPSVRHSFLSSQSHPHRSEASFRVFGSDLGFPSRKEGSKGVRIGSKGRRDWKETGVHVLLVFFMDTGPTTKEASIMADKESISDAAFFKLCWGKGDSRKTFLGRKYHVILGRESRLQEVDVKLST